MGEYTGLEGMQQLAGGMAMQVAGNQLGFDKNKKLMAIAQEYNKENAQWAYDKQIEAWNMANEYNDPKNVAARYRAAGISPQAALGGSAAGAGVSDQMSVGAPAGSSAGHVPQMSISPTIFQDMEIARQQNAADLKIKDAQARKLEAEAAGQENENSIFATTARLRSLTADNAELEKFCKTIDAMWLDFEKIQDASLRQAKLDEIGQTIKESLSRMHLNEAQTEAAGELKNVYSAQVKNFDASTGKILAETETENVIRAARLDSMQAEIKQKLASAKFSNAEAAKIVYDAQQILQGDNPPKNPFELVDKLIKMGHKAGRSYDYYRRRNDLERIFADFFAE